MGSEDLDIFGADCVKQRVRIKLSWQLAAWFPRPIIHCRCICVGIDEPLKILNFLISQFCSQKYLLYRWFPIKPRNFRTHGICNGFGITDQQWGISMESPPYKLPLKIDFQGRFVSFREVRIFFSRQSTGWSSINIVNKPLRPPVQAQSPPKGQMAKRWFRLWLFGDLGAVFFWWKIALVFCDTFFQRGHEQS